MRRHISVCPITILPLPQNLSPTWKIVACVQACESGPRFRWAGTIGGRPWDCGAEYLARNVENEHLISSYEVEKIKEKFSVVRVNNPGMQRAKHCCWWCNTKSPSSWLPAPLGQWRTDGFLVSTCILASFSPKLPAWSWYPRFIYTIEFSIKLQWDEFCDQSSMSGCKINFLWIALLDSDEWSYKAQNLDSSHAAWVAYITASQLKESKMEGTEAEFSCFSPHMQDDQEVAE